MTLLHDRENLAPAGLYERRELLIYDLLEIVDAAFYCAIWYMPRRKRPR